MVFSWRWACPQSAGVRPREAPAETPRGQVCRSRRRPRGPRHHTAPGVRRTNVTPGALVAALDQKRHRRPGTACTRPRRMRGVQLRPSRCSLLFRLVLGGLPESSVWTLPQTSSVSSQGLRPPTGLRPADGARQFLAGVDTTTGYGFLESAFSRSDANTEEDRRVTFYLSVPEFSAILRTLDRERRVEVAVPGVYVECTLWYDHQYVFCEEKSHRIRVAKGRITGGLAVDENDVLEGELAGCLAVAPSDTLHEDEEHHDYHEIQSFTPEQISRVTAARERMLRDAVAVAT